MLKEFKQFLLRGSVVDLAVGVVIGAAFTSIVNALVSDLLTPFISAVARVPDFGGLIFTINGTEFKYGHFMNAIISFVLVASAVFFLVVKPMNVLVSRAGFGTPTKRCPECKSMIPREATRCAHCTQPVI